MFDALRFLQDQFTDADGVLGMLSAYGLPNPPRDTARKWFQRRSVPSEWLPLLICAAELEQGAPVRMAAYIDLGRTA
jgi:hypothetical protein